MTTVASPFTGRVVPLEMVATQSSPRRCWGQAGGAPHRTDVVAGGRRIEKLFPGGHGIAIETAASRS